MNAAIWRDRITWRRLDALASGLSADAVLRHAIKHRPVERADDIVAALDRGLGF